jgi:hypothetical protein
MKDYNLHYFTLKLPLDATTEEVELAYQDEVRCSANYPAYKMAERMAMLNMAREALAIPANRQLYHEEKWKECYSASNTRTILKATGFWPLYYGPRRPGPMPDSFEGLSLFKSLRNIYR